MAAAETPTAVTNGIQAELFFDSETSMAQAGQFFGIAGSFLLTVILTSVFLKGV